ncbi:diphthine methyl ester synthase-like [Pollicipes pollicipes]|uniref:diphthine methyl ester synthase-like n=1 Tax=Pollicipes pollicipes TaxID=41117 RepID=UPI0018854A8D|nr:diphthine methyl ester synthase-like [Pollicipes pollicipes]XP_037071542.1 diphthine methyl ester synthase-like [Pollicipes pollicipes]XP_037071555.1 diphthine methyl ester synthase-like [Pollicipes pollicipes]XP_037071556.1 diphthine methyl ester synthase-like [Pollicipes pollicipes]
MFYLVGLGLGDARDISVKGLEIVRRCDAVYLEAYTSILTCGVEALEELYGRPVTLADRETVEQGLDSVIAGATERDVALLVVGDPFAATTHHDLVLRAAERGVPCQVVHNASIMSAVGCCGLQLYSFGETVSIPFWTETWRPDSFVERIDANLARGLHTLCLLDIKVKEQSVENLVRGRRVFEPPRYMSVSAAAGQLLEAVADRPEDWAGLTPSTRAVGLARVGTDRQRIEVGPLRDLAVCDAGPPLHSLVIVGKTHPMEEDFLKQFEPKSSD